VNVCSRARAARWSDHPTGRTGASVVALTYQVL